MKSILLGSVVVILLHVYCAQGSFKDSFFGTWTVHHSDNFEAYLAQRKIPWFMRQMIKLAKLKRTYGNSTSKDGYYECAIDTDNDKEILWTFKLNEEFVNEYLEGTNHTIKITYDGKVMNETHSYENNPPERYQLSIDEGYLVIVMKYDEVTTRRFYQKGPSGSG